MGSVGQGSISFSQRTVPASAPGLLGADNGLSVLGTNAELFGPKALASPLLNDRYLNMGAFSLYYQGAALAASLGPAGWILSSGPATTVQAGNVMTMNAGGGAVRSTINLYETGNINDLAIIQNQGGALNMITRDGLPHQIFSQASLMSFFVRSGTTNIFQHNGNIIINSGTLTQNTNALSVFYGSTGNQNGNYRFVVTNSNAGGNAAAGALFINDVGDSLQFFCGSSTSAFIAHGVLFRSGGVGGFNICADTGPIAFSKNAVMGVSEFARFFNATGNFVIASLVDNATDKLQVTGSIKTTTTLKTGDPGSGIGAWKLGVKVVGAVVVDNTQYIEVDVGGVVYKLIIST